jgi:hypothetical protein
VTIREARQILAEYRALLDLGEWDIRVRWSRQRELPDDEWGSMLWNPDTATAIMVINRGARLTTAEIRSTVVHELLHVTLQGHRDHTGVREPMFERGLNRIAGAILAR